MELKYPASWDLTEREAVLRAFRNLQKKNSYWWSFCLFVCFGGILFSFFFFFLFCPAMKMA